MMVFFKKWPKNHPKFLLHFLIHIDVLMLCSKFELFPTNIFQVTGILRNRPISEKCPRLQLIQVFLKMAPISPHILSTFSMSICYSKTLPPLPSPPLSYSSCSSLAIFCFASSISPSTSSFDL